ncbi:MAG: lipocalin-like domain-containing protein [Nitrospiria bacterium]
MGVFLFVSVGFVWAEPGTEGTRFEKALPGYRFAFPRDHGSHPTYLIEWWYFTGNLQSKSGDAYGYELTFFRRGIENTFVEENPSRWTVRDLYLAHFAVSDLPKKRFFYEEKISRAALGKAGAKEGEMEVWIDRWSAVQEGETMRLIAGEGAFRIALELRPAKPLVIHGTEGVSRKGDALGDASHYYSFTRLMTEGSMVANGKEIAVTGLSWMDHEFGSSLLGADQVGWDWFSIQLDDGSDYMFYQIREKGGGKDAVSSGTAVAFDGTARHLRSEDFTLKPLSHWTSSKSGGAYPLVWEIALPSEGLVLRAEPAMDDQELMTDESTRVTYWEGASRFSGTKRGETVSGAGYIELTGYAGRLND